MSSRDVKPKIVTGLPGGKVKPRVDPNPHEMDQLIIARGYRMWWSRAGICPCQNNDQTEQADPNCSLCRGRGYFYYMPDIAVTDGALTDIYNNPIEISPDNKGVSIFVIKTSLTADTQVFEKFGEWVFGATRATVQWQNRLGYRDRLIERDSTMIWNQVIDGNGGSLIQVTGGRSKTGLRYPVVEMVYLRSVSQEYREGRDIALTTDGELEWLVPPPAAGTRLTLSCFIHPVWIILDHIHAIRDTLIGFKTGQNFRHTRLPVQSMMKLDFLIDP